jgi:DNA-directed RNA polymerase sigma subunit (sigma70/sigma32)
MSRPAIPQTPHTIVERNQLVEDHRGLVPFVAGRLQPRKLQFAREDLLQEGYLAIVKMATRWVRNPAEDARFSTSAVKEIRKQMASHARRLTCQFKLTPNAIKELALLERGNPFKQTLPRGRKALEALQHKFKSIHSQNASDPAIEIPVDEIDYHRFDDLYASLGRLRKDERELIDELFGLSGAEVWHTDAAIRRGLTPRRVRQLRELILRKLRRIMERKPERDFFPRGANQPRAESQAKKGRMNPDRQRDPHQQPPAPDRSERHQPGRQLP